MIMIWLYEFFYMLFFYDICNVKLNIYDVSVRKKAPNMSSNTIKKYPKINRVQNTIF